MTFVEDLQQTFVEAAAADLSCVLSKRTTTAQRWRGQTIGNTDDEIHHFSIANYFSVDLLMIVLFLPDVVAMRMLRTNAMIVIFQTMLH